LQYAQLLNITCTWQYQKEKGFRYKTMSGTLSAALVFVKAGMETNKQTQPTQTDKDKE